MVNAESVGFRNSAEWRLPQKTEIALGIEKLVSDDRRNATCVNKLSQGVNNERIRRARPAEWRTGKWRQFARDWIDAEGGDVLRRLIQRVQILAVTLNGHRQRKASGADAGDALQSACARIDLETISGNLELVSDLCIVGSGAAGLAIATEMIQTRMLSLIHI